MFPYSPSKILQMTICNTLLLSQLQMTMALRLWSLPLALATPARARAANDATAPEPLPDHKPASASRRRAPRV